MLLVHLEHALVPWPSSGAPVGGAHSSPRTRQARRGRDCRLGPLRHHQRAQLGVGAQRAMEPNQVQTRAGHQRRQPLHELQRRHDQMRGAVALGCLRLEHQLTGGVGLHALVGQGRPGDVAAQLLQRLPVVGCAAHGGVQLKPLMSVHSGCLKSPSLGIAPCTVNNFWPVRGPKAMRYVHATACSGLSVRASSESPSLSAMYVEPLLFDQQPPTGEQLHRAGDDLVQHRLQRFVGWRAGFDEPRRAVGAAPVHAVQHQAVQVYFEVGRRGEALNQRDGAAVGFVRLEPGLTEQAARDHAVRHPQHGCHQLGLCSQQQAQRDRQRKHPLVHRHMRDDVVHQVRRRLRRS